MTDLPTFILDREFDAPRDLVWKAWTNPELLARWYGPGVETVIHKFDLQPGGLWLNEMKWGENSKHERVEFTEVSAPERLVWLHSSVNEKWEIAPNPMMKDWPRVLLTTITFEEAGGKTKLRLTWAPHEASQAELDCFEQALAGLDRGWGAGMEMLAQLLEEIQAKA